MRGEKGGQTRDVCPRDTENASVERRGKAMPRMPVTGGCNAGGGAGPRVKKPRATGMGMDRRGPVARHEKNPGPGRKEPGKTTAF